MLSRTTVQTAASTRARMFWSLIVTLAVGQLIAIWMLCNHQVRQAELRHANVQAERLALADCLRFTPQATPQHCAVRLAERHLPSALVAASENTAHISTAAARPVSFQLR